VTLILAFSLREKELAVRGHRGPAESGASDSLSLRERAGVRVIGETVELFVC